MRSFMLMLGCVGLALAIVHGGALHSVFDDSGHTPRNNDFAEPVKADRPPVAKPPRSSRTPTVKVVNGTVRQVAINAAPAAKTLWTAEVKGPPRDTREAAWESAYAKVAAELESRYELRIDVPIKEIEDRMVVDSREETQSLGENLPEAKRVTLSVELKDDYAKELAKREREYRVGERLSILGKVLAGIVALLLSLTAYLRIDDWSKGYLSGFLKAIAVIGAAGAGVVWYAMRS